MIHSKINHRQEVAEIAELTSKGLAVDVGNWGITEPMSDPENTTIYRTCLFELSNATFDNRDEYCEPHYPNAPYGSIWDY